MASVTRKHELSSGGEVYVTTSSQVFLFDAVLRGLFRRKKGALAAAAGPSPASARPPAIPEAIDPFQGVRAAIEAVFVEKGMTANVDNLRYLIADCRASGDYEAEVKWRDSLTTLEIAARKLVWARADQALLYAEEGLEPPSR